MNDKILSMVGMARRAMKTSSGGFSCEKAVKGGNAQLVILACDAADNTKKQFCNSCGYYNIPLIEYSDMLSLGKCIGTEARAVVSVNDKNFAKAISDIYNLKPPIK